MNRVPARTPGPGRRPARRRPDDDDSEARASDSSHRCLFGPTPDDASSRREAVAAIRWHIKNELGADPPPHADVASALDKCSGDVKNAVDFLVSRGLGK
jgi:hypothetical protein